MRRQENNTSVYIRLAKKILKTDKPDHSYVTRVITTNVLSPHELKLSSLGTKVEQT